MINPQEYRDISYLCSMSYDHQRLGTYCSLTFNQRVLGSSPSALTTQALAEERVLGGSRRWPGSAVPNFGALVPKLRSSGVPSAGAKHGPAHFRPDCFHFFHPVHGQPAFVHVLRIMADHRLAHLDDG
jgi:hypothetical protein